jgi:hypothetical protein
VWIFSSTPRWRGEDGGQIGDRMEDETCKSTGDGIWDETVVEGRQFIRLQYLFRLFQLNLRYDLNRLDQHRKVISSVPVLLTSQHVSFRA